MRLDNLPTELTGLDQWACWQWRRRDGKWTKIPVSAITGVQARSNDPDTGSSFESAVDYMKSRSLSGVGFMFHPNDGFAGVDLDGCRDADTGVVEPWALEIVSELESYSEVSPSDTGIKVFVRGELPPGRKRRGSIEMYDRGRFFATTGQRLESVPCEVRDASEALYALHVRLFGEKPENSHNTPSSSGVAETLADAELLEMARHAANGEKFQRLYFGGGAAMYAAGDNDGRSEADLALCSLLAFWCGPDTERIDWLFRGSALCREKWLRRPDYRELTIAAALERGEFWSGRIRLSGARRVSPIRRAAS
ncbi:hypothetical protein BH20ACT11_BH20ACT11_11060 [soil metagenome]